MLSAVICIPKPNKLDISVTLVMVRWLEDRTELHLNVRN